MKKRTVTLIVSLLFALSLAVVFINCGGGGGGGGTPPEVVTGTATLTWTAPSTKADGSPLDDLAGFWIYYGTDSGSYSQTPIRVPCALSDAGRTITHQVTNLPAGNTYYFVVTAYNTSQAESAYSNEGSKTIN